MPCNIYLFFSPLQRCCMKWIYFQHDEIVFRELFVFFPVAFAMASANDVIPFRTWSSECASWMAQAPGTHVTPPLRRSVGDVGGGVKQWMVAKVNSRSFEKRRRRRVRCAMAAAAVTCLPSTWTFDKAMASTSGENSEILTENKVMRELLFKILIIGDFGVGELLFFWSILFIAFMWWSMKMMREVVDMERERHWSVMEQLRRGLLVTPVQPTIMPTFSSSIMCLRVFVLSYPPDWTPEIARFSVDLFSTPLLMGLLTLVTILDDLEEVLLRKTEVCNGRRQMSPIGRRRSHYIFPIQNGHSRLLFVN